jgi:actin cytoskeleton-regulatory complex protein SLA1
LSSIVWLIVKTTASQGPSETTPLMANSVDHAGAAVPPIFKDVNILDEDELDVETRNGSIASLSPAELAEQNRLRLQVDIRLCSIAGLLCSLNLLDSGVISNAAVTSMLTDLKLDVGNRYAVSIFIFTIASIAFQLPSTIAVRTLGPRIWFAFITFSFGIITLCTAFVKNWKQMIALRILLGIAMSGIYPGLTYLISTWYTRKEQQLRFALLQSGEVIVLATGGFVNFGLNQLGGSLKGWQWMFLVQGLITSVLGIVTYWVSSHMDFRHTMKH